MHISLVEQAEPASISLDYGVLIQTVSKYKNLIRDQSYSSLATNGEPIVHVGIDTPIVQITSENAGRSAIVSVRTNDKAVRADPLYYDTMFQF